jgi:hypothetical protein
MSLQDAYRQVFRSPGGDEVIADLARHAKALDVSQQGGAALLLARITHMLHGTERPTPKRRALQTASGGRIAHGG